MNIFKALPHVLQRESLGLARFKLALEDCMEDPPTHVYQELTGELLGLLASGQVTPAEALACLKPAIKGTDDAHRLKAIKVLEFLSCTQPAVSTLLQAELTSRKWRERFMDIALHTYDNGVVVALASLVYRWAVAYRDHEYGVGWRQVLWDLEAEGLVSEGAWKLNDGPPQLAVQGLTSAPHQQQAAADGGASTWATAPPSHASRPQQQQQQHQHHHPRAADSSAAGSSNQGGPHVDYHHHHHHFKRRGQPPSNSVKQRAPQQSSPSFTSGQRALAAVADERTVADCLHQAREDCASLRRAYVAVGAALQALVAARVPPPLPQSPPFSASPMSSPDSPQRRLLQQQQTAHEALGEALGRASAAASRCRSWREQVQGLAMVPGLSEASLAAVLAASDALNEALAKWQAAADLDLVRLPHTKLQACVALGLVKEADVAAAAAAPAVRMMLTDGGGDDDDNDHGLLGDPLHMPGPPAAALSPRTSIILDPASSPAAEPKPRPSVSDRGSPLAAAEAPAATPAAPTAFAAVAAAAAAASAGGAPSPGALHHASSAPSPSPSPAIASCTSWYNASYAVLPNPFAASPLPTASSSPAPLTLSPSNPFASAHASPSRSWGGSTQQHQQQQPGSHASEVAALKDQVVALQTQLQRVSEHHEVTLSRQAAAHAAELAAARVREQELASKMQDLQLQLNQQGQPRQGTGAGNTAGTWTPF